MIEIRGVSKSFGSVCALRGVDLEIAPGERVAFVGSNGSGKTTLLRALLGLLRFSGQIEIHGFDVSRDPAHALSRVAYIPQVAPPIEASVHEVVLAHATLRGIQPSAVAACASRMGLDLGEHRRARFRDLSGGMRQKLLASLALATRADVLVCDEPTANLDVSARTAFFEQLAERSADSISIFCSHRLEEVEDFVGRIVELREGVIVHAGRPRQLRAVAS
jgi:ABC-type multidrug transport system ATPase subunit